MDRWPAISLIILLLAAACSPAAPTPTATLPATERPAPSATALPAPSATMAQPSPTATPSITPSPTLTPTQPPPTATTLPSLTPSPTPLPTRPATRTVCASGCDHSTIQKAIDAAAPSGEIILIVDPLHTEAGILVDKDITLRGRGHDQTIVQAASSVQEAQTQVFIIPAGATVVIESMTIRHGHPRENPWAGGAVTNSGTLTVRDCVITGNQADHGGGLWSEHSLTVVRCLITRNRAYQYAPPGYECGSGGGIKATKGDLVVADSTIANNQAEGKGGGAFLACAVNARIENSSISENRAHRYGGGVAFKGTLTMTHCTISGNSSGEPGGGLYLRGTLAYSNTIIADNAVGGDCTIGGEGGYKGIGILAASSYNLVEDGSCQPAFTGDPGLLRLAPGDQNWLPVQRLDPDGPAVDVIPASFCPLAQDQRGLIRPVVLHNPDTPCDIGAVEEQARP